MATSISKSKWNGDKVNQYIQNKSTVLLSYAERKPECEVLQHHPEQYINLYQRGKSINRLYFGDNINVLSALKQDKKIVGHVELIYIDPPFATGGIFQSRTQDDAYTDLLQGASYIEFLRQRLILLRELLSQTGSIYVHLDSKMVFAIKMIMDEIFGENNFRNLISRKKSNPKNYTRKTYGNISDYILFYTKTDNYTWNRPFEPWTKEQAKKEYQYIDKKTGKRYKKVPVHAPGTRNGETGKPWRGKMPPPGKHWQYTPTKLEAMDQRGEIYWSPTDNPRRKIFLEDSPGKAIQDIWLDTKDAHNQNIRVTGYPTEKNQTLLERIVKASSNPGDIVLDCFSGSGTTLVAANKLDRNWIGVDNSQRAISTILKRFVFGSDIMGDFVSKKKEKRLQISMFDSQNNTPQRKANHQPILEFSLFCKRKIEQEAKDYIESWLKILE